MDEVGSQEMLKEKLDMAVLTVQPGNVAKFRPAWAMKRLPQKVKINPAKRGMSVVISAFLFPRIPFLLYWSDILTNFLTIYRDYGCWLRSSVSTRGCVDPAERLPHQSKLWALQTAVRDP